MVYVNGEGGWGEGSKTIEKQKFQFVSNIAYPHPDPPPLRASPCRGGGFFDCKQLLAAD